MLIRKGMMNGLMLGLFYALAGLLAYKLDLTGSTGFAILLPIIGIAFHTFAVKSFRDKENDGLLSIKESVILVMSTVFCAYLISSALDTIHLNMNPTYFDYKLDVTIEAVEKSFDWMGLEGAERDKIIDETAIATEESLGSPFSVITVPLMTSAFSSILGLILGAIFKKEKSIFEDTNLEEVE
jgi:hypothetical protein